MQRRYADRLTEFSHRLAQIKFIILEIVIFIGFLLWLWDKVKHDFNLSIGSIPKVTNSAPNHSGVPAGPSALSSGIMALIDLRSPIDPSMMDRLNKVWRTKICPVCLTNTWNVEQQIAEIRFLSTQQFMFGGQVVPLVVVTCQTCGNTLLFNAVKLGWVPRTGVPPSPPGGGQ